MHDGMRTEAMAFVDEDSVDSALGSSRKVLRIPGATMRQVYPLSKHRLHLSLGLYHQYSTWSEW